MTRRPLVAGNWKMNGLRASLAEIEAMGAAYDDALRARAELIVCPPATLIALARESATRGRLGPWRAGLPCRSQRRSHGRHFRRDAQGRRRVLRHRRPQ